MTYRAPVAEMCFALETAAPGTELASVPGSESPALDLVQTILGEAARFAETALAPLNQSADHDGSVLENGVVRTPTGFREAYARYAEGGWNGLSVAPEHGGQGLPLPLATAVSEMWNSACMSFALCPLLSAAAIELLQTHGSTEQKARWLGPLVAGDWTGTMNLTEPQAGSDLGTVRCRAEPRRDPVWGDHYRVTGQKIFITYGDHDLAANIVHMVLARTPGAPAASRGLSLFLVPKFLPDAGGAPGPRNDVRVLRLERKLGIHASPTCVMAYEDAVGWRVGDEHQGLELMFTMMNHARLGVGLQGVAIAERAYQQARDFARERVQGRPLGIAPDAGPLPILHHPDVRRMLLWMRAATEAMRALAYYAAGLVDRGHRFPVAAEREPARRRADLMIPVVKAWCTDLAVAVASTGIQVHGGMGYIEDTGAAQHLRDARILPIYEGTNGIQANDLVGRKLQRDGGAAAAALADEIAAEAAALVGSRQGDLAVIGRALAAGAAALAEAGRYLADAEPAMAAAGSVPCLGLFGTVAAGWRLAIAAREARRRAEDGDASGFFADKLRTARFYAEHFLGAAPGCLPAVKGGATVLGFAPERL